MNDQQAISAALAPVFAGTKVTRRRGKAKAAATPAERIGSERARRIAAVILDVLAGNRTPSEAAKSLELSLARYYTLEQQGIVGLIAACEPRPTGPTPDPERDLTLAQADNRRLQQALMRQQALVRATQRSLGVAPPPIRAVVEPGKRRKRRPVVRALRAIKRLENRESPNATVPVTLDAGQRGG